MKSSTLLMLASSSLGSSFLLPLLSIPLQASAVLLFLLAESRTRHEIRYVLPIKNRRYQAWEAALDHAVEYETGALQGHRQNRIDWRYRRQNHQLNLTSSTREKYLRLFTEGDPQLQTVNVQAQPVHPEPQQPLPSTHSPPQSSRTPDAPQTVRPPSPGSSRSSAESELPELNIGSLLSASLLLVWGTQGGGKTTFAKLVARAREQQGHAIAVADPHGSQAGWGHWPLIGAGRKYEALNSYLEEFDALIDEDYDRYSEGERDFPWSTLIVDEFTLWADRCDRSGQFVKTCCSDLRKVHRCVILVSHSDTLAGLGDAKGMAAAISRSAIKLELETEIDVETGLYSSLGTGLLQYPGKKPVRVRIPRLSESPDSDSVSTAAPAQGAPSPDVEATGLSPEAVAAVQRIQRGR